MNNNNGRWKRILLRISAFILIFAVIVILVASPLTKYLAEKYDVKYTGREITIGRLFINPFAGFLKIKNLDIYEENSDSVFLSVRTLKVNLAITKILAGTYEVSSLTIDEPGLTIIRNDTIFNFSDLVKRFAVAEDTVPEEVLHLNILNIRINDGRVIYREKNIPLKYTISAVDFRSKGKHWDADSVSGEFSLKPGEAVASGDFMINTANKDYRATLDVRNFDLGLAEQYLSNISKDAVLGANVNLKLRAAGNFNDPSRDLTASGRLEVRDFNLGKKTGENFAGFDRFLLDIKEINLKEQKFYFDSILIARPLIRYELYDTLDNFRRLLRNALPEAEEATEEVDSANILLKILDSDFSIQSLALTDGTIHFNDYSIAEKFSFTLSPFTIKADSIEKAKKRVNIEFNGKIQPDGSFAAFLSMNPKKEDNFDFKYNFKNIPATLFNPYITTYTSYQLDRGTIEMNGDWSVRNANINSNNHFIVVDPRDTKRVRGKDSKWIPLPLIMSFVRERGSVIDYEIPVKGNLKDPKFKLHDVITDILRNILVKPPTTPYRLQVRNVEQQIEKTLTVKWRMRQTSMDKEQEKFMGKIARFLKDNKDAIIVVDPIYHETKEKENILFFEAKKKYFIETGKKNVDSPVSREDSMKIEKMPSRDSTFIRYLDRAIKKKEPGLLTLQEKCYFFIGPDAVNRKYNDLREERKRVFMKFFKETGTEKQVEFLKEKNQVPYNWFSYFKIDYKGDVPDYLAEAFSRLYEINTEPPRKNYFDFKRRTR